MSHASKARNPSAKCCPASGHAMAAVVVFVAMRSGVLAVTVILVVSPFLGSTPFTLTLSRWYAGRGLLIAAAILAAAIWAFSTSLGGRRAMGALRLGDV